MPIEHPHECKNGIVLFRCDIHFAFEGQVKIFKGGCLRYALENVFPQRSKLCGVGVVDVNEIREGYGVQIWTSEERERCLCHDRNLIQI